MAKSKKLQELENIENSIVSNETSENYFEDETTLLENNLPKDKSNYIVVDGHRILPKQELPYGGRLYPESWEFSFRCPTTEEIAEFSTIDDRDTPKIQEATSNLLKKCYTIIDTVNEKTVPSSQINEGDRLFFFLKLREYYMEDMPISYPVISAIHQEQVMVNLMAHNLVFKGEITDKMLERYDGRKWSIPGEKFGLNETIEFLNPTIEIGQRIFKYMTNKYREANESSNPKQKKSDLNKKEFDKKFLMLLPFLYVDGNEKIESLYVKYKNNILPNEKLFKAYLFIINNFNHTNENFIYINYKGDEESTEIKFPGEWKNMFIDNRTIDDIF